MKVRKEHQELLRLKEIKVIKVRKESLKGRKVIMDKRVMMVMFLQRV